MGRDSGLRLAQTSDVHEAQTSANGRLMMRRASLWLLIAVAQVI
jgi:hypothetical protein